MSQVDRRYFIKRMGQAGGLLLAGGSLQALLAACGGNVPTTATSDARVKSEGLKLPGTLQWGATADNGAPYVYHDPTTSKLVGFELEIAEALAKLMGIQQKQIETDYTQLGQALHSNQFDMILNGWEITEDRKEVQIFSQPYYLNGQQIVVRKDDDRFAQYTEQSELSLSDLEGLTVGTGAGFYAEELLLSNEKITTKSYDPDLPFNDLAIGRIDAVLIDYSTVTYYALGIGVGGEKNDGLRLIGQPFEFSEYVIAFNKNNQNATTLQTQIDEALTILKQDGTLRKIYEKWGLWNDKQTSIGVQ